MPVKMESSQAVKKLQRQEALQRRNALSPRIRKEASRMICEKLLSLNEYQNAETVFLFRAFGSEADLSPFASQAETDGKILLYPRCTDRTHMLALRPGKAWETGSYGIQAPVLEDAVVWEPEQIDLILCPCSGFDSEGRRLGMGAGYYDRYLPRCKKAFKILVAFEAQRLERVSTEACDVTMDAVVTESDFFHC